MLAEIVKQCAGDCENCPVNMMCEILIKKNENK